MENTILIVDDARAAPAPAPLLLDGELTIYRASELKPQLLAALPDAGAGGAEFDLSQVTEIDTAGVQLLLLARHEAASRGFALTLAAPSATVRETFALLRLSSHLAAA